MGCVSAVGAYGFSGLTLVLALVNMTACDRTPVNTPVTTRSGNEMTNTLQAGPHDVHALLMDQTLDAFRQGTLEGFKVQTDPPGVSLKANALAPAVYTSRVIETSFPFNELIPSTNVDVPEGAGFAVEVRVGRSNDNSWSPFYTFGSWGKAPVVEPKSVHSQHGAVQVDYFRSTQTFDRIQYRMHMSTSPLGRSPVMRRFALVYSHTTGDVALARARRETVDPGPRSGWERRLPVPWRSQLVEEPAIAGRLCSPTCVAMVMAYRGVDLPTGVVARAVYDEGHDIYGNWARAVQGAYTFGVPGYLMRFGDWDTVRQYIANDQPIIASVRIDKGQLSDDPARVSTGHLLVITGFDGNGNVYVNDPGVSSEQRGVMSHPMDDLAKIWLANGGVGYILLSRAGEEVGR